jgi:hypothetical protein
LRVGAEIGWIDPAGNVVVSNLEIFQHKFYPPVQVTITKAGFYTMEESLSFLKLASNPS